LSQSAGSMKQPRISSLSLQIFNLGNKIQPALNQGIRSRKLRIRPWWSSALTTWHPPSATVGTNFAKRRSLGIVCSRTKAMEFFLWWME
jgi:hypothetical protein